MRRLSIHPKPDRPDIDDLIFGGNAQDAERKVTTHDRFRRACRETAAAWFLYLF